MAKRSRNIVLVIERDNLKRDTFMADLVSKFTEFGYELVWHKSLKLLLDPDGRYLKLPKLLRWLVKVGIFVFNPTWWKYYFGLFSDEATIEKRCAYLKRHVSALGKKNNFIVFSRSAGGLVASLVADEIGIKSIVCLGYPFKQPNAAKDPKRYAHLAVIKTPMLIMQGINDKYGGISVTDEYELSSSITCEFIDTDHDFRLTGEQWNAVHSEIMNFISDPAARAI